MKTGTLHRLLQQALLVLILLASAKVNAQGPVTFSKPRYSMHYSHDGNNWNHISNSIHTYNSEGLETEAIATHPVTGQNEYKKTITYNASGFLTAYTQYYWQNNTWVLMSAYQNAVTYNSGNKVTQLIHSSLGGNNTWVNQLRYDFAYDPNQNLLEETYYSWDIPASVWLPQKRVAFTYNTTGIITEKQYLDYVNNAWVLERTETFTAWHIPNTLPASYNTIIINMPDIRRNTVTLNPNGGNTNLTEMSFDSGNSWLNFIRHIELRDAHGNIETKKFESFNLGTNTWQVASEEQNLRTYNSQSDITEMIVRQGGSNFQIPGSPIDREKYVYSNFQYFTRALGTSEDLKVALALNVFPNPATDRIQIALAENKPQALTATIQDMTGRIRQTQNFTASEKKQLNIEALPKGIYLLQVQTESGLEVKRIIKQ